MRTDVPLLVVAMVTVATLAGASTAAAQAVAGASTAGPQAVAGDEPPGPQAVAGDEPRTRPYGHPHAGMGGGVAVGVVRADGVEPGWLARVEYEVLPALAPRGTVGGYFGFMPGLEMWRAGDDNWGVALPIAMELGVRAPGLRAGALFGFEAIMIDQVADDTGTGFYAPLAGLRAVLDVGGVTAGVDARVIRRWQIGADDHTQLQVAFVLTYGIETRLREPIR